MDIDTLVANKKTLEHDLRQEITKLINNFKANNETPISDIDINFYQVNTVGKKSEIICGEVKVNIVL